MTTRGGWGWVGRLRGRWKERMRERERERMWGRRAFKLPPPPFTHQLLRVQRKERDALREAKQERVEAEELVQVGAMAGEESKGQAPTHMQQRMKRKIFKQSKKKQITRKN